MRKTILALAALAMALMTISPASASSSLNTLYSQDFESSTGDWLSYDATLANAGGYVDVFASPGTQGGTYSYYGGVASDPTFRSTPIGDGIVSELDVLLDVDAPAGYGFDLTVATSRTADGSHQQDHIFHVGVVDGQLLVNSSNNADFVTNSYKLLNDNDGAYGVIPATGWYTFQHVFSDDGNGFGQVTFNVVDADDDTVWTATRPIVDSGNAVPTSEVGGPRYMWFTHVDGGYAFDNQLLGEVVGEPAGPATKDDCKKGGFESFGFDNQGQCIASLKANANAGK